MILHAPPPPPGSARPPHVGLGRGDTQTKMRARCAQDCAALVQARSAYGVTPGARCRKARGGRSSRSRSPPSNTSTGSTTAACTAPTPTSHPPNSRPRTTVNTSPTRATALNPLAGMPRVCRSRAAGFSGHDDLASVLELSRRHPAQGAAPTTAVVSDLEVLEDGVGQLDAGPPALAVEQLDLHPRPERLDHGVVEAVPDAAPSTAPTPTPWLGR